MEIHFSRSLLRRLDSSLLRDFRFFRGPGAEDLGDPDGHVRIDHLKVSGPANFPRIKPYMADFAERSRQLFLIIQLPVAFASSVPSLPFTSEVVWAIDLPR